MKILLLNPPSQKVVEPLDRPDYPHIGLGYIAAYLKSKNHDISVIDARLEGLNEAEVLERIGQLRPDLIGLTAYTQDITYVAGLTQRIKERYPSTLTVIGGTHATVLPAETMEEFPAFDFVIFAEGEHTMSELVEAVGGSGRYEGVEGLGFRSIGDKIHINKEREWNTELDKLPFPAWDLFPKSKRYPVITSRGCPFRCIFCTRPYGTKVRERSPGNIVAEIRELVVKHGADNLIFWDETFGVNKKRAIEISDMMVKEGLNERIKWIMHSRVDTVDLELLEHFKRAGCVNVGFGVESGNNDILKMSKKGITLEQVEKAVKMSKKLRLGTSSYFILGFPYETRKTAWDTINFARRLNTDTVSIARMIPFPKTEIADMVARGEGGYRRLTYSWSDYDKQTGGVIELNTMSRRTLTFFQLAGYLMFYVGNLRFVDLFKVLFDRFGQIAVMALPFLKADPSGAAKAVNNKRKD